MSDVVMTYDELLSSIEDRTAAKLSMAELQDLLATNPTEFFDAICQLAVEEKASDIFWKTGTPPCIRIAGRIVQLDLEPLTPTQLEEIFLYGLMSEEQREKFKKRPELDTAMEIPGVIRFRVNIYRQRGAIGVVMRLIPLDIPTIEELGLPTVIAKLVTYKQGMVLVTGPTGMRQIHHAGGDARCVEFEPPRRISSASKTRSSTSIAINFPS